MECGGSIGSSGWVGGPRNMKSMWPPLAAIFFMTYFYRAWGEGGMAPSAPPLDPLLGAASAWFSIWQTFILWIGQVRSWTVVAKMTLSQSETGLLDFPDVMCKVDFMAWRLVILRQRPLSWQWELSVMAL